MNVRPLANNDSYDDSSLTRNIDIETIVLDSSSLLTTVISEGFSKTLQVLLIDMGHMK